MDNYLYIASIDLLENNDTYNKAYQIISKQRRDKVDKLKFINDKKLSILSEVLLKKALTDLNIDINFELTYNKYQKPYLYNNDIYFNISHSVEYAICAISKDEVGCDIEYIKDIDMRIANKFFTNNEYNTIINSNNHLDTFYRIWTLKESFMKNLGLGFNLELNDFEIELSNNPIVIQKINNNKYYFKEIEINDYKCSVCLLNNNDVVVRKISLEQIDI